MACGLTGAAVAMEAQYGAPLSRAGSGGACQGIICSTAPGKGA